MKSSDKLFSIVKEVAFWRQQQTTAYSLEGKYYDAPAYGWSYGRRLATSRRLGSAVGLIAFREMDLL